MEPREAFEDGTEAVLVLGHSWWLIAFEYAAQREAKAAYEKCAALLQSATAPRASAYRVTLNGHPVVVILGDGPLDEQFEEALDIATGEANSLVLPEDVATRLLRRSLATWATETGFIERRDINEVVE